jgi:hypothetical protein
MYVGPKKFVESDFVTRMRLKYSTTTEEGEIELTPKAKIFCRVTGFALGAVGAVALNAVANRTILKDNSEATTED